MEKAIYNDAKSTEANQKRHNEDCKKSKLDLKVGDWVLLKQKKTNKFKSFYEADPYRVTAVKGTMITATSQTKVVTRNSSFYKKIALGNGVENSGSEKSVEKTITVNDEADMINNEAKMVEMMAENDIMTTSDDEEEGENEYFSIASEEDSVQENLENTVVEPASKRRACKKQINYKETKTKSTDVKKQ